MFYETQPLHFSCTQCGRCCVGGGDYHVFLTAEEAEAIRRELGISQAWFKRRYLTQTEDGELVATAQANGACVFLQEDGSCRVYAVRPVQCRTYPWWPDVIHSQYAWKREAKRCEGIGRGDAVPVEKIRKALAEYLEIDVEALPKPRKPQAAG